MAFSKPGKRSENVLGGPWPSLRGVTIWSPVSQGPAFGGGQSRRGGNVLREVLDPFTGECPMAPTQKMIICPDPFCNARVASAALLTQARGDR